MPTPEIQYLDASGAPLAGAFLCSFAAGTSTPQATYTDSTGGTPNTNPVVLDSFGRASVWVKQLGYKFVLYTGGNGACPGTGVVQWSQDNVSAIFQQVNSLNGLQGALTLVGESGITVALSGSNIQIIPPQDLSAAASPTFLNLVLTGGQVSLTGINQGSTPILIPGGILENLGNVTSAGQIVGASFAEPGGHVIVDATQNGTFANLTVTGTCTGCSGGSYPGISTQGVVTGSRALGTVYHNASTTLPMYVTVTVGITCSGTPATVVTDSSSSPATVVAQQSCSITGSPAVAYPMTFFVLPNNYYKVTATGGTLQIWTEWQ